MRSASMMCKRAAMWEKPEKEAMMQRCDRGPVVTVPAPGCACNSQFPATAAEAISRHIGTCVFPGEKIAVVPVLGVESKDHARATIRAM